MTYTASRPYSPWNSVWILWKSNLNTHQRSLSKKEIYKFLLCSILLYHLLMEVLDSIHWCSYTTSPRKPMENRYKKIEWDELHCVFWQKWMNWWCPHFQAINYKGRACTWIYWFDHSRVFIFRFYIHWVFNGCIVLYLFDLNLYNFIIFLWLQFRCECT